MEAKPCLLSSSADSAKDALRIQHQELAVRILALDKENERLRRLRNAFNQERLQFNGESELGRRQLDADRADILRQQRRLTEYRKELKRRAQALAAKERQLADTKHQESIAIQRLTKEAEGLEQRIRTLRVILAKQEQDQTKSRAVLPDVSHLTSSPDEAKTSHKSASAKGAVDRAGWAQAWEEDLREYLSLIDMLACCLADERLRLFHQVEHLVEARNHWEKEHLAGIQELEARFGRLEEAERTFENRSIALRKQKAETHQARQALESRQARVTIQAANWKGERERLLARIHSLETIPQQPAAPAEADYARFRQQLTNLEDQRAAYETQVAELNAEVERLAQLLLEESDAIPLPVAKAA